METGYVMELTVSIAVRPVVMSVAQVTVSTSAPALIAVIRGEGQVCHRSDNSLTLDASASTDPAREAGELTFAWRCWPLGLPDTPCVDHSGASIVLPNGPVLATRLPGSFLNAKYYFELTLTKGVRITTKVVEVGVRISAGPMVYLTPLNGASEIINANDDVLLEASASTSHPAGIVSYSWEVLDVSGSLAQKVDLTNWAMTPLTLSVLKIKGGGWLRPGRVYEFKVDVTDEQGVSTASWQAEVNPPPATGTLEVTPASGEATATSFDFFATDWADSNLPLTYSVAYQLVGSSAVHILSDFQPMATFTTTLPEAGEGGGEGRGSLVDIHLRVKDSKGAISTSTKRAKVTWPSAVTLAGINAILARSASALASGSPTAALIAANGAVALTNRMATAGGDADLANLVAVREGALAVLIGADAATRPTETSTARGLQSAFRLAAIGQGGNNTSPVLWWGLSGLLGGYLDQGGGGVQGLRGDSQQAMLDTLGNLT
jgi:hypothetical protein